MPQGIGGENTFDMIYDIWYQYDNDIPVRYMIYIETVDTRSNHVTENERTNERIHERTTTGQPFAPWAWKISTTIMIMIIITRTKKTSSLLHAAGI